MRGSTNRVSGGADEGRHPYMVPQLVTLGAVTTTALGHGGSSSGTKPRKGSKPPKHVPKSTKPHGPVASKPKGSTTKPKGSSTPKSGASTGSSSKPTKSGFSGSGTQSGVRRGRVTGPLSGVVIKRRGRTA
jgi:hypothetical protein